MSPAGIVLLVAGGERGPSVGGSIVSGGGQDAPGQEAEGQNQSGGAAEISLTDPDNVLESGIEIKAAPPGKIIKNMVQLSGGEQAFIGVALFFATLKVNPTPFCILDEIEAALDEVNVARFAEYIKKFDSIQFILITHRRGTMEAANRLYGVTMPERGILKVLELDVNEISKKKGEDWDGIFGQA